MAATITDDVRSMIKEVRLGFFATASKDGVPNVSPKGSIRVIDEQTLVFAEIMSSRTRANLRENPSIAVLVYDPAKRKGYQIKGKAELITGGELWDKVAPPLIKYGYNPNYVVKITPEEIYPVSD